MAIDFECSGCGQKYRVNPELAGRATTCKKCQATLVIPGEPATALASEPRAPSFHANAPTVRQSEPSNPFVAPKTAWDDPDDDLDLRGYGRRFQGPVLEYAGFWPRVAASLIDGLVLMLVAILVMVAVVVGVAILRAGGGNRPLESSVVVIAILVAYFGIIAFCLLYPVWMVSSPRQATVGKIAMGLRVVDLDGERLGFGRSIGRQLAKAVSCMVPFGIGFLLAAFTEKRQALHDMIASTLVVKNR